MTPEEFARESWQNDAATTPLPPIVELRDRADKFRTKIKRRNLIEYLAGLIVIVAFGAIALLVPMPMLRLGAALTIGGTCVVMWQLHRRGSPLTPPEDGGQMPVLEYQRRELVRQRDALDSIFTWYLLPLIPGMAVIMLAPLLSMPLADWQWPPVDGLFVMAAVIAVFIGIYALNKFGARHLQGQIDEIDALRDC